jgi:hypothetical protein
MVSARDLLAEAERRGARFRLVGNRLEASPAGAFDDSLIAAIGTLKGEIIAELCRRLRDDPETSRPAVDVCGFCFRTDACLTTIDGTLVCPACAEWRVTCPLFVVSLCAADVGEKAACISCGASWEMHGSPPRDKWRVVDDVESVTLFEARLVLAKAASMITKPSA